MIIWWRPKAIRIQKRRRIVHEIKIGIRDDRVRRPVRIEERSDLVAVWRFLYDGGGDVPRFDSPAPQPVGDVPWNVANVIDEDAVTIVGQMALHANCPEDKLNVETGILIDNAAQRETRDAVLPVAFRPFARACSARRRHALSHPADGGRHQALHPRGNRPI